MSLLILDQVTKRLRQGRHEISVLSEVTMEVAAGELVAVRGARRSGRSTLLQVAAGLLAPDQGRVLFAGRNLVTGAPLGRDVAWATPLFDRALGRSVAEQVGFPLLVERSRAEANQAARHMLAEVGAGDLGDLRPGQCQHHELLLAGIARAMVRSPRLVVLDEPVTGLSIRLAEQILELLRAIALNGTAVLFTEDEAQLGVDRTLTIDGGRVRGSSMPPAQAEVIPIRGEASA